MSVNWYITEPSGCIHQVVVQRQSLGKDCFDLVRHHLPTLIPSSIRLVSRAQGMQAASY